MEKPFLLVWLRALGVGPTTVRAATAFPCRQSGSWAADRVPLTTDNGDGLSSCIVVVPGADSRYANSKSGTLRIATNTRPTWPSQWHLCEGTRILTQQLAIS